ncbi:hypothetical protein, partial [Ruegeria arenilitoris]|uniref:hypothetical protein n=1 Tax=Ruegeria arenilitoris TaxID=1173585 RepID=UPI001C2C2F4D
MFEARWRIISQTVLEAGGAPAKARSKSVELASKPFTILAVSMGNGGDEGIRTLETVSRLLP